MRGHLLWAVIAPVVGVAAAVLVAGCGGAGTPGGRTSTDRPAAPAATTCGTSHTAAGVPVEVLVKHGHVACRTALALEREYTHDLASGKVPGNGGGAPVTIRGWVCQGFNTPTLLATGNASACRKGGTEILAVLPSPAAATPTPTPS